MTHHTSPKTSALFPAIRLPISTTALALGLISASALPQDIPVPNFSFESQSGVGQPFNTNINIDSWQKAARPDYFPESGFNGFFWIQTAGVFVDTNPYLNHIGTQAAYVLNFPGAGVFQDYDTLDWNDATPSHDFDATYEVGKSYTLTLGLFGKSLPENSLLQISLYYRDTLNNLVTVGTPTQVFYQAADFPTGGPLSLVDKSVTIPEVLPGDVWAGENIGIKIESVFTTGVGTGYWDYDNVRLTATPEPGTFGLLALGLSGLAAQRRRSSRPAL